jgi:hypothetical protein
MRRPLAALIVLLACAAVGFAAATVIGSTGDAADDDRLAGKPGSEALDTAQPDPSGAGREWAVTVFTARNGQKCAAVGRRVGDKVGSVAPDGTFTPYPIEDGASCIDLEEVPAGAQVSSSTGRDRRTTVHGLAGPRVRRVILGVDGVKRRLRVGARGAFLAVLGPEVEPDAIRLTATLDDGSELRLLG